MVTTLDVVSVLYVCYNHTRYTMNVLRSGFRYLISRAPMVMDILCQPISWIWTEKLLFISRVRTPLLTHLVHRLHYIAMGELLNLSYVISATADTIT